MSGAFSIGSAVLLTVAAAFGGCSFSKETNADLVSGKQLFVQKCGSCHTLAHAATKGTVGPNLDQAFQQPQKEGFGESAIRGVIKKQILFPARGGVMPARLVTGNKADDIAAYAKKVHQKLIDAGLRSEIDLSEDNISAKIKARELQKIPYMAVVGAKESAAGTVAVREHKKGNRGVVPTDDFVSNLRRDVAARKTL